MKDEEEQGREEEKQCLASVIVWTVSSFLFHT